MKIDKSLLIMYWPPKMPKKPIGVCFIGASTNCRTKLISKAVSIKNLFSIKYKSFYDKSHFYSSFK